MLAAIAVSVKQWLIGIVKCLFNIKPHAGA